MKHIFFVVTLVVAISSTSALAQKHSPEEVATAYASALAQKRSPEEKEVLQTYKGALKALLHSDVESMNRYFANDALFLEITGTLSTKQEYFKRMPAPNSENESEIERFHNLKNRRLSSFRVKGNNAVLKEKLWFFDGKKLNETDTITCILAKQDGNWKVVVFGESFKKANSE